MNRNIHTIERDSQQPTMFCGDCFHVIDTIEIADVEGHNRCIVRWGIEIKWIKNTIWKSVIQGKSRSEAIKLQKLWLKEAIKRKLLPEEQVSISHELENAMSINELRSVKIPFKSKMKDIVDTVCFFAGGLIAEKKITLGWKDMLIVILAILSLILLSYISYAEIQLNVIISQLREHNMLLNE